VQVDHDIVADTPTDGHDNVDPGEVTSAESEPAVKTGLGGLTYS